MVVEDAEMDSATLALVCDGYFTIEEETGDRKLDGEGHEHWGWIVDE